MTSSSVDGVLILDKPPGISSMEVVRRIKRASGVKKVGHAGTLDPMATGVIPICLGNATRLMEYMFDSSKEYVGEVCLGVSTDSYDADGQITHRSNPSEISRDMVEDVLESFSGQIEQTPPMFSALKKRGRRLYELARQGIEVEREPRPMTVHSIRLANWRPPVATVRIECSRGFYMRSLAHDIGARLGCGAHLQSLVRLRTGCFRIDAALSLDAACRSFQEGVWRESLISPDIVLGHMRAIIVGISEQRMIQNGGQIPSKAISGSLKPDERFRAYTQDGRFLAIMRFDTSEMSWQPHKVFIQSDNDAF